MSRPTTTTLRLLAALAAGAWSLPAGAEPVPAGARGAVQSLVDGLDRLLADPALSPAARRALLERELEAHLDFGAMSQVALGAQAESMSTCAS